MASATGLFNQNECDWDGETLSLIDVSSESLSPLGDTDSSLGELRPEYASRWPSLKDARWFPALGDGATGNVGSGCLTRERAALNIGTSGALRVAWRADEVKIPRGLWCYRIDSKRFVMGGALSNGGDLFAWMQETLKLGAEDEVEAELARMKADEHGLTLLPFLSGERSTGWQSEARAAITGMSLDTTPIEILRAGLEAVAYRFAAIYDLIAEGLGKPSQVIASGAAVLRSPAWAQIISDVIGADIAVSSEAEASSRGAALMALEALKSIPNVETIEPTTGQIYSPEPESTEIYAEARKRQDRLYEAIIKRQDARTRN
jgi:gluconokinase